MSWNYRVIKKDDVLAIHAIYYDNSGKIIAWSENAFSPEAADLEELKTNLELMVECLDKEVIDLEANAEGEK